MKPILLAILATALSTATTVTFPQSAKADYGYDHHSDRRWEDHSDRRWEDHSYRDHRGYDRGYDRGYYRREYYPRRDYYGGYYPRHRSNVELIVPLRFR